MPGLPPEEVSLTVLTPPAMVQGQPNSQELFNENDFLGPGLNIAEFYEDVEDVVVGFLGWHDGVDGATETSTANRVSI